MDSIYYFTVARGGGRGRVGQSIHREVVSRVSRRGVYETIGTMLTTPRSGHLVRLVPEGGETTSRKEGDTFSLNMEFRRYRARESPLTPSSDIVRLLTPSMNTISNG